MLGLPGYLLEAGAGMKQRSDPVRRTKYCKAKAGAYGSRKSRVNHWWAGGDVCVWCKKTRQEVRL